MLAFNVINLEQHRALQQNAARAYLPESRGSEPPPTARSLSCCKSLELSRRIPDSSTPDFASATTRKIEPLARKNGAILAKWAPTSNRNRPINRCYRKQTIKPRLTGARTHIRETAFRINFRISAAALSDELRLHSEAPETPSQSSNLSETYGRS
jgi:hypothetical protein